MFERYTERARRTVFFAHYEAGVFGSRFIEPEHLLLGLLREDRMLVNRFLRPNTLRESIRKKIEANLVAHDEGGTPRDLRLSNECKRVLACAAEEAHRLSNKHIGGEHLLLGLLRDDKNPAARMLNEAGIHLASVREDLTRTPHNDSIQIPDENQVPDEKAVIESLPPDVLEAETRIRSIVSRMEEAITKHDFEKARECADEERRERQNLRWLYKQHGLDQ